MRWPFDPLAAADTRTTRRPFALRRETPRALALLDCRLDAIIFKYVILQQNSVAKLVNSRAVGASELEVQQQVQVSQLLIAQHYSCTMKLSCAEL